MARSACMVTGADMTVAVMRTEHTAVDLRRPTGGSDDAAIARHLLAPVPAGHKRADAARLAGMERRALRGWSMFGSG